MRLPLITPLSACGERAAAPSAAFHLLWHRNRKSARPARWARGIFPSIVGPFKQFHTEPETAELFLHPHRSPQEEQRFRRLRVVQVHCSRGPCAVGPSLFHRENFRLPKRGSSRRRLDAVEDALSPGIHESREPARERLGSRQVGEHSSVSPVKSCASRGSHGVALPKAGPPKNQEPCAA